MRNVAICRAISHLILITVALPVFAGLNRWTTNGPDGTSVRLIRAGAGNPPVLYALTSGGRMFRSSTADPPTWESADTGVRGPITALGVDPLRADVVYAGTLDGVVFLSLDGGRQWVPRAGLVGPIREIVFDPAGWMYLLAGDRVLRSDGEGQWRGLNFPPSAGTPTHLAITSQRAVFAATASGIFTLPNPQGTWTMSTRIGASALAANSASPVVYAAEGNFVWWSINGAQWGRLAALPSDINALAQGDGELYVAAGDTVFGYDDIREDWIPVGADLGAGINGLTIAGDWPTVGGNLWAATDRGPMRIFPFVGEWTEASSGITGESTLDVVVTGEHRLFAASSQGVFARDENLLPWRKLAGVGETLAIAKDGSESVYVAGRDGIQKTSGADLTWEHITTQSVSDLAVSGSSPATIYAIYTESLAFGTSRDGGVTWSDLTRNLPYGGYYMWYSGTPTLEADPDDPETAYLSYYESFLKTTDGGESWSALRLEHFQSIAARGTMVHAGSQGVLSSQDGGRSWSERRLADEVVSAIAIDPVDPARAYAGTLSGRIYRTLDYGGGWTAFDTGLAGAAVRGLSISSSGDSVYAATAVGVFEYRFGISAQFERLPPDAGRLPDLIAQIANLTSHSSGGSPYQAGPAFLLQAGGTVRGSRGMLFRTDVTLSNARAEDQEVVLAWLSEGNSGGPEVPMFRATLEAHQSVTFLDLSDHLQIEGLGSVLVIAVDSAGKADGGAAIDGIARIWSQALCGSGTVSQSLAGVTARGLAGARRSRALGLRHDAQYRTNVGIVNLSPTQREFTLLIEGERRSETQTLSIPPFTPRQTSVPDGIYGALSVTVVGEGDGAHWSAYASSVDNASGDAWAVMAMPLPE